MTENQILNVAMVYIKLLISERVENVRCDTSNIVPFDRQLEHALWMLMEIYEGNVQGDKAERWLCFVQGVLFCHGLRTVDEMREDNRP